MRLLGEDPRVDEAALPVQVRVWFTQGNSRPSLRKGSCQIWCAFQQLLGSLCLSPILPAVLSLAEVAETQQTSSSWPHIDQMADCRLPTPRAPTVGCAQGGRAEAPTEHAKMAPMSCLLSCLSPAWGRGWEPWSGVWVSGRSSCKQKLKDRDVAFGDLSALLGAWLPPGSHKS